MLAVRQQLMMHQLVQVSLHGLLRIRLAGRLGQLVQVGLVRLVATGRTVAGRTLWRQQMMRYGRLTVA